MGRKETVWGARHIKEEEEIRRIIEYFESNLNIRITKIEASAAIAARSQNLFWSDNDALKFIRSIRGIK